MFFFCMFKYCKRLIPAVVKYNNQVCFCCSIDASNNDRLARYVNDSPKKFANCKPKPVFIGGTLHVVLFATKAVEMGREIRYDYGGGDLP